MSVDFELTLKLALGVLGFVVWFIRLEGKVNYQEKQIIKLENDQKDIQIEVQVINSNILKQLSEIKESIARIEGRLSAFDEK